MSWFPVVRESVEQVINVEDVFRVQLEHAVIERSYGLGETDSTCYRRARKQESGITGVDSQQRSITK